ncbi:GGDEF domain-containing protein [Agarivorans gilvus]|uniref:GGDEF domain-containing protein n=1 Tax=Agarivorans gilvus TaxID=680279 RepID=A0ABQ1I5X3_9ALTE|nr:diguanylate cyclase [Agarivorans gilvus]GGB15507.1 hypothetical protein GCM10007414_31190 [Agarivorans gilvus]
MAELDLVSFFHGIVEPDSGYWLYQASDSSVSLHYPWQHTQAQQLPLEQWLKMLDKRCRGAFQQALANSLRQQQALVCHYCHSEDEWLRLNGVPMQIQQQSYLLASVLPLTMPVITDETQLRDPQTGLLSATLFRQLLIQAIRLSQRNYESFVVLSLRYRASDLSLVTAIIAQVLQQQLRRSDSVGRWEDNELLALLYGTSANSVNLVVDKLRDELQAQLVGVGLEELQLGWTSYPRDGESVDSLLARRLEQSEPLAD